MGRGSYASVYRYKLSTRQVAVKCFRNVDDAQTECKILKDVMKLTMQCPGIV